MQNFLHRFAGLPFGYNIYIKAKFLRLAKPQENIITKP